MKEQVAYKALQKQKSKQKKKKSFKKGSFLVVHGYDCASTASTWGAGWIPGGGRCSQKKKKKNLSILRKE